VSFDPKEQLQSSLGDAYTIERELGGGGMSRTYVAMEPALGRKVVVKMLSPELAAGVSVERFKREIQLAATLQHPHVVPVLSTGDAAGLPWFTMPFVEGESLRVRLSRGPLRIVEATGILKDVARALEFAHSHGVVHRDIKPDNVLLAGSSATVTDFGIAKALSAARDTTPAGPLTMTGTSIGTPTYMAPEQAAGDPSLDHRSDIYSFGVMAYELLAGRPPFDGMTPVKLMNAHFTERPRDLRDVRADTPPALAELVMRCLEKEAAARPQSASDVVRVLETVTSSGAVDAAPVLMQRPMRLGRALVGWLGATIVVAVTAWAATNTIGLTDWVFPGALGVMLAGLPAIGITWYVQKTARRVYTATPTFTPGGTPSMQGTLATMAIKASPHVSWRRTWIGGAIAVGAFAVLVIGFMVMRALGIGPAGSLIASGKFGTREQLIITDFKSPAGDSTLGLTITEALRANLSESSALQIVPRLSINETLRLMRRDVSTPIDFDIAREIATRDGIKAVLDGNVVSLGGRYVVSTRLLSAQSGEQLASFTQEAASQNDLIPAIGRLAKQLRAKVGESLKTVREASALDRVTTGSMDALAKYTAALTTLEQTGDYTKVIPLLEQAVAIDSNFAMAWRRLAAHFSTLGMRDSASRAVTHAYAHRDRLTEVERRLTEAAYFTYGPEVDEERALEAFEAALARDSVNLIALNNASLLQAKRRDYERAAAYRLKAAAQDKGVPNPVTWTNAIAAFVSLGRVSTEDSLLRLWATRSPNNPNLLINQARVAAFDKTDLVHADSAYRDILPKIASSRTITNRAMNELADVVLAQGHIGESFRLRARFYGERVERGQTSAMLLDGIDSAYVAATIRSDPADARAILQRALRRMPLDSLSLLDRPYEDVLWTATLSADPALAQQIRDAYNGSWWPAVRRWIGRRTKPWPTGWLHWQRGETNRRSRRSASPTDCSIRAPSA
jgi:tetratricopeptide (TPR) repeat protein